MKIDLNEKIDCISIFYNVTQDCVIQAMKEAFLTRNDSSFTSKYSLFYHRLAESGYIDDFYGYIYNLVRYDDNIWAREIAKNADVSKTLISQVKKELQILNEIAKIDINSVKDDCPIIKGVEEKKSISYDSLAKEIKKYGFGIFSKYDAFLFDGNLNPILNPPDIKLSSLIGFHSQQEEIISNTKAFLDGKPANNVLLAGDRGTGKSSTVCGVFNMFKGYIKLIELPLPSIKDINVLIGMLKNAPQKFIVFIDDLVVDKDNINAFYPLKAALEGSMLNKSPNVLIYATSNRRHLIKESFQEREDDIHKSDGLEDTLALSDRFGLTILFQNLNKQEYLGLVASLAAVHNIPITEQLKLDAEKWAIIKAVRSPRTAVQFVNAIVSGIKI